MSGRVSAAFGAEAEEVEQQVAPRAALAALVVLALLVAAARARTGGVKGAFGLAEDRAEASIACRQVAPLVFSVQLPAQEEVFSERMSILFKRMRVVRMVDAARNTLVYMSYSDKLIDGSPQNSVTAVPVDRATAIPLKK